MIATRPAVSCTQRGGFFFAAPGLNASRVQNSGVVLCLLLTRAQLRVYAHACVCMHACMRVHACLYGCGWRVGADDHVVPGGYATPAQLVVPLHTKWLLLWTDPFSGALTLCRATPRSWLSHGETIAVKRAPTAGALLVFCLGPVHVTRTLILLG